MAKSKRDWYPRYSRDLHRDTIHLPLKVRCVYEWLLDFMYEDDGPIPDDDKRLSLRLGIDVREFRPIKERLFSEELLDLAPCGGIIQRRAAKEIAERRKRIEGTAAKRAQPGANNAKRWANGTTGQPGGDGHSEPRGEVETRCHRSAHSNTSNYANSGEAHGATRQSHALEDACVAAQMGTEDPGEACGRAVRQRCSDAAVDAVEASGEGDLAATDEARNPRGSSVGSSPGSPGGSSGDYSRNASNINEGTRAKQSYTRATTSHSSNSSSSGESLFGYARAAAAAANRPMPSKAEVLEFQRSVIEAASPVFRNAATASLMLPLSWWIADGCDPHLDIVPEIERIARRPGQEQIRGWKYFSDPIKHAKEARESGAIRTRHSSRAAGASQASLGIDWDMIATAYLRDGLWPEHDDVGAKPGQLGCKMPRDKLAEYFAGLAAENTQPTDTPAAETRRAA